jgi:undecaprenyl-diphosphatase
VSDWAKALLLGVIEGITEFLPISSTGHLLVAADLLRFEQRVGGTFEIFIQFGAVLAVLSFYARDLAAQARAARTERTVRRFWLGVVVAFVPAAVAGLLLRDWIKAVLFASPTVIAWSLITGGVVLILVDRLPLPAPVASEVTQVTLGQAVAIGIAQVAALIPGVSRSGAAQVGGLLAGLDRRTATSFSFYLALPTLGAATLLDLATNLGALTGSDLLELLLGTSMALVVAWLSIGWLLRFVAARGFLAFGLYRIAAGLAILALLRTPLL